MESIKRDLSELKDAVQLDPSSMVYSTASLVKNTLTEIGNTVNEIGSLGTIENESSPVETPNEEKSKDDDTSESLEIVDDDALFNMDTLNLWTSKLTTTAKSTINMVKETLSDSMFINRNFSIEELEDEPFIIKDGQIIPIDNWKELLNQLRVDPNTYCREPSGSPENFDSWLTEFNLMNYQKQMEYLLENDATIRKYHDELVPKTISDSDFWHRYYYKVFQLKEQQKMQILKLDSQSPTCDKNSNTTVNIKYLTEQSSDGKDSDLKVSRSSTEEWEKMVDSDQTISKESDSKHSSDDDRDWVKCD